MPTPPTGFRDPSRMTWWVQALLYTCIALLAAGIVSDLWQLELLASAPFTSEEAEANDLRQRIISTLRIVSAVGAIGVVSVWTYRASSNAHRLGAQGLRYSPRWAVAGYFIPLANLWMPYQAMKEIAQASRDPSAWQGRGWPRSLPLWWFSWLATYFTINLYVRKFQSANTIDALVDATWADMLSAGLAILAAIFLANLVREISDMQVDRAYGEQRGPQGPQDEAPTVE
jgi:heme/copper-type cytochrome/quinol oxidase subunit 2